MSEMQTSVNTAPIEAAVPEIAAQETTETTDPSSVVAEPASEVLEQPTESRIDKAFAARLRKEQEKFEKQYESHKYVIERAAADNGMSVEEYLQAVRQQYEDKEFENLDPAIKEDVKWARQKREQEAREAQSKAREEQWQSEVRSLLERFPSIKSAKDIPEEVLESRLKDGVSLRYAYADYMLGKERTQIEQETIRKLQDNTRTSPGSLGSVGTDSRTKISDLSQDEFNKLKEEVLRGTRRSL